MSLNAIFSAEKTFLVKASFHPEPFKAKISRADDIALELYLEEEIAFDSGKLLFISAEKTHPKKLGRILAVPLSQIQWGIEYGD